MLNCGFPLCACACEGLAGRIREVGCGGLEYSFHAGGILLVRRQTEQTTGVLKAVGRSPVRIDIEALHEQNLAVRAEPIPRATDTICAVFV
jgi:hypothetical protein